MEQGYSPIIKNYRNKHNLTLQEMADALAEGAYDSITRQAVSLWEKGNARPSKFFMVKLALQTFDWRRDMACEVLKAMDPNFSTELCAMLMGAEH